MTTHKRFPYFVVAPAESWWTTNYAVVPDPDADTNDSSLLDICIISADFPKIPHALFARVANLFKDYADKKLNNLEVAVGFFYNPETKEWKCLVPTQKVTGTSVDYDFTKSCDIVSGQELSHNELLRDGFLWMSRTHSHNTMTLDVPSGIDDKTEIPIAQFCCLLSNMKLNKPGEETYRLTVTVVQPFDPHRKINRRYFNIPRIQNLHWTKFIENVWDFSELENKYPVDLPFDPEFSYHPNCCAFIKEEIIINNTTTYTYTTKYLPPSTSANKKPVKKYSNPVYYFSNDIDGFNKFVYSLLKNNEDISAMDLLDVLMEVEQEVEKEAKMNEVLKDPFFYSEL